MTLGSRCLAQGSEHLNLDLFKHLHKISVAHSRSGVCDFLGKQTPLNTVAYRIGTLRYAEPPLGDLQLSVQALHMCMKRTI